MRAVLSLLLTTVSCTETVVLDLPLNETTPSAILVVEHLTGLQLWAVERDMPVAVELADNHRLVALLYDRSLMALGIEPGPLSQVEPSEPWRPLPAFLEAKETFERKRSWVNLIEERMPGALLDVRIADIGKGDCETLDGCFPFSSENRVHCEVPCPSIEEVALPDDPAAPEPPAVPRFTPCPDGWSVATVEGIEVCDPPAAVNCAADMTQFLGEATCVPAAGPCPIDDWPEGLLGDVDYVGPNTSNGSGTKADPFRTIQLAINSDAAIIAVHKGLYNEQITVDRDVSIVGACTNTEISGFIHTTNSSSVTVRNLRIGHSDNPFEVAAGTSLHLSEVEIVAAGSTAINAQGQITADRILVRDGRGVLSKSGGDLTVRRSRFENIRGYAMLAEHTNSRITAEDVWINGVTQQDNYGHGAWVRDYASLTIRRSRIEQTAQDAVIAVEPEVSLRLEQVLLEPSMLVAWGARLVGSKVRVTGNQIDPCLLARRSTTTATISDLFVTGCNHGIQIDEGPEVELARVYVGQCAQQGLLITGATANVADLTVEQCAYTGIRTWASMVDFTRAELTNNQQWGIWVGTSTATLTDVSVTDTAKANDSNGDGLAVVGSQVVLSRLSVSGSEAIGIQTITDYGSGTTAAAVGSDLRFEGNGLGIKANPHSSVRYDRVWVVGSRQRGIILDTSHGAELHNVTVRDSGAEGIQLHQTVADLERIWIERSKHIGLAVYKSFNLLDPVEVRDATITLTTDDEYNAKKNYEWDVPCGGVFVGGWTDPAFAELERVRITDSEGAGVVATDRGSLVLKNAKIEDTVVGIDLRTLDIEVPPTFENVFLSNNERNVLLP